MDWIQAGILAILLFLVFSWMTLSKSRCLPPGPWGLPLLGYFPFLGPAPHLTLTKLGKKYDGVFTLPLFHKYIIVLTSWPTIKEALIKQSNIFSSRPPTLIADHFLDNSDISFSNGIESKERRRFLLRQLKDFSLNMENVVTNEMNKMSEHLTMVSYQPVDVNIIVISFVLNTIWTFVGSKRFDYDDPRIVEFINILETIFQALSNCNIINFVPATRHWPNRKLWEFMQANDKLNAFLDEEIETHLATFQDGHNRDFIDAYLAEINKCHQQKTPSGPRSFQKKHLKAATWDLFLAGIDTTSSTILWGLLYMITWPEIQRKVQQEMDELIGRARQPTSKDITMLPYTMAVLLEIQRYATIVPLSLMHYTATATTLSGYTIPKSTIILENIWAVHRDPELWGDPEVFRPERFLNDKGEVQKPEYLIPFSVGGRMCPGEIIARMEVSMAFAGLLHRFSFSAFAGQNLWTIATEENSLTRKPPCFSMTIQQR